MSSLKVIRAELSKDIDPVGEFKKQTQGAIAF
jgi:hypothetical protein